LPLCGQIQRRRSLAYRRHRSASEQPPDPHALVKSSLCPHFRPWRSLSVRVSPRPDQVGKRQNNDKGAPRFELLEEARQKISEHKDFEAARYGGSNEPKRPEAGIQLRRRGSEQENDNGCEPGKTEQDQRFNNYSPARRCFFGFIFALIAHNLNIAVHYPDGREKTASGNWNGVRANSQ
jgi:hypothetical protein